MPPILAQGKDTVIVAHGGVIGGLMYRWFPGMPHRFVWTPDPGHGYQITFEGGKPVSYCTIPEHGTLGPDPVIRRSPWATEGPFPAQIREKEGAFS